VKYATDFRADARDALRGRWPIAILTGFVASLIGAGIAAGGGGGSSSGNSKSAGAVIRECQATEFWFRIRTLIIIVLIIAVVWLFVAIIIGGAGKLGYAIFNLNLVDRKEAGFSDLFSQFHRLGDGFCMNFLMPYQEASYAAFYRDVSSTQVVPEPALNECRPDEQDVNPVQEEMNRSDF
jgi:hypothetical protein